ncbi:PilZ domain-containing protein [Thermomonas brevis]
MNREAAEAALFGDTLSCEETQRAAFVAQAVDATLAEALCLRAETNLHAIAVIEDTGGEEDDAPLSPALRRIEARLELVMTMLGAVLRQDRVDPLQALCWSALGARVRATGPVVEGSTGLFRIQATPWLPEPLELPAVVIACRPEPEPDAGLWLRFAPLSEGVRSALERHLFRQHRRAIAVQRARADAT